MRVVIAIPGGTGALQARAAVSQEAHRAELGSDSEPARDRKVGPGDQLRSERERRGVAIEQVAASTKIRKRYLEALERHDWQALPEGVFTRGYLRAYAQYLGMDPERVLKAYAREQRIAHADDASLASRDEREDGKAILTRLAQTRGVFEPRRVASRIGGIGLALAAVGLGAIALWNPLELFEARKGEWIVAEAPVKKAAPAPAITTPAQGADLAGTPAASPAREPAPALEIPISIPPATEPSPKLGEEAFARKPLDAPAPAPVADPTPAAGAVEVADWGVGRDVVGRRLVGQADRFEEGSTVWFWNRVVGGQHGDDIRHVWFREGRRVGQAKLAIGGAHWRTQSRQRLPKGSAGEWTVEARDPDGRVLASSSFTVSSE